MRTRQRRCSTRRPTGNFVNAVGLVKLGENRRVRLRYQRRRDRGHRLPRLRAPYFFNATSLPHSNLDKVSARYEAQAVTPWLANLSLTAYYQRTERLLRNTLPVQFPAPTPVAFFPITVMRLSIVSETEQRVWTPGVDLQAVFVPATNHVLTTGATFYRDRSSDHRITTTTTSMVGQVVLGARGPAAVVFPAPVLLGPASVAHPVRVPDASLARHRGLRPGRMARDAAPVGHRRPARRLLRRDHRDHARLRRRPGRGRRRAGHRSLHAARPPAAPRSRAAPSPATSASSPTPAARSTRSCASAAATATRISRSCSSPARPRPAASRRTSRSSPRPATTSTSAPSSGPAACRAALTASSTTTPNFIAQEFVAATPAGPLAQAINFGDVRIRGLELSLDAPVVTRAGVLTLSGSAAPTRGHHRRRASTRPGSCSTTRRPTTSRRSSSSAPPASPRRGAGGGWSTACARRPR